MTSIVIACLVQVALAQDQNAWVDRNWRAALYRDNAAHKELSGQAFFPTTRAAASVRAQSWHANARTASASIADVHPHNGAAKRVEARTARRQGGPRLGGLSSSSSPQEARPDADTAAARPPPPTIGQHVTQYLQQVAAARSPLIGEVEYTFSDSGSSQAATRPLRIAQYSNVYGGPSPAWAADFVGCDRPCVSVGGYGNASAAAGADVVVINMMNPSTPWVRPPGQVWVGAYFESPDHCPTLRDASILARFNYTTGYRPDADFPIFNMVLDTASNINMTLAWPLPSYELKQRHPMMSTWISNCRIDSLGRLELLDGLARHDVSIASYGKCGPGRARPEADPDLDAVWRDWVVSGPGAEKAAVSAQHLFMYAAENSWCAYYTTEKVWHAFLGGSVPVYVGDAAFLKKLTPPSSVIYAADFEGPAALAAHLKHLATNRTAYESHLAWRADAHALDTLHRFMALPTWEARNARSKACALCEFLWAAPRRIHPEAASDLCQPLGQGRARFHLRLL